jgi:hypothetical protein
VVLSYYEAGSLDSDEGHIMMIILNGLIVPLTLEVVNAEFVNIIGHLGHVMDAVAAFGSAELATYDE